MKPEDIADIVREHLTAVYVCNRTWSAWSYNTMSQDDFVEASETEMADEIAAAIVKRYGQPAQPAASAEHFAEVVGGGMVFWRCGTPPDGTKLYTAPVAAQPRAPVCPYPCGWESLHTMATEDGAYLAKSLEVGHLLTDNERSTAIVASIRLIEVCRAMLEAAPEPKDKP